MRFPPIVSVHVCSTLVLAAHSLWAGATLKPITCRRTFANVIADLVSRGAADQSLAHVAPRRIHAALVQLAGACRQTLVYVC